MPRIACLLVPDLPVAAACRADPDLAARPLALSEGGGPHAPIVAAAAAARACGVRAGHTVAQARAIAADLIVRPRDDAAERSAVRALVDVAASLASRIEAAADGAVFLDAAGAAHLVPSEAGLATALVARAARVGLAARAAVIRRLGDLARLPVAEVATRLGPAGAALVRAARGEDERPLAPQALGGPVEEAIDLEHALDALEPLLFVLRGLVERAVARVGLEGIGVARLGLALGLEDRSRDERTVPLAAPTRDVKTLLTCIRAELEARPPRAAVERVVLAAVPEVVRAAQLGLFNPAGPSPERLATTLARLAALCGAERVGAPAVIDSHQPGAAGVTPFTLGGAPAPPFANGCRLVVRALRPPRPVEVFADRDRPDFVRGEGLGGRVVGAAGPWRVVGEWWSDGAFARDYYDLELSDGGLYRCFRENGRWFVDGVYD